MRRFLTRRTFLAALPAMGLGAFGLYARYVEPHWLHVARRTMPIAHLPTEFAGATLAQLSDLHVGPDVDDAYLLATFDRVRELAPAIVVYTGDFVSYYSDVRNHAARILPRLALGTQATYAILGNHDYGHDWHNVQVADYLASLIEEAGVQVLRNQAATLRGLTIVGLDDVWADRFEPKEILSSITPDDAAIALVHNPDAVDRDGWGNFVGWILSGHTHGGQCKPPFLPPPILPVRNLRYTRGEFALSGGRRLYVNSGIGHLTQVRFNVRPEITLFQLTRAAESSPSPAIAGSTTHSKRPPSSLDLPTWWKARG